MFQELLYLVSMSLVDVCTEGGCGDGGTGRGEAGVSDVTLSPDEGEDPLLLVLVKNTKKISAQF